MGNSYPDRTNSNGVWKISDIYKNSITHKNFPRGSNRAIYSGGIVSGSTQDVIEFLTIETLGNATDFGDTNRSGNNAEAYCGLGNVTRGVFAGGNPGVNLIDFITIMSTGDSADFGDLSVARASPQGNSNDTRGLWARGYGGGAYVNTIDFDTI